MTNKFYRLIITLLFLSNLFSGYMYSRFNERYLRLDERYSQFNKKVSYPIAKIQSVNEGMTFYHQTILLDGIVYNHCHFKDVLFYYQGIKPILIFNSVMEGDIGLNGPAHTIYMFMAGQIVPFDEIQPHKAPEAHIDGTPFKQL